MNHTYLMIDRAFLVAKVTEFEKKSKGKKSKKGSTAVKIAHDVMNEICFHKCVNLKYTARLRMQCTATVKLIMADLRKPRSASQLQHHRVEMTNEPPWKCLVVENEFVTKEDFERCCRELQCYEAQGQTEEEAKKMLPEAMRKIKEEDSSDVEENEQEEGALLHADIIPGTVVLGVLYISASLSNVLKYAKTY